MRSNSLASAGAAQPMLSATAAPACAVGRISFQGAPHAWPGGMTSWGALQQSCKNRRTAASLPAHCCAHSAFCKHQRTSAQQLAFTRIAAVLLVCAAHLSGLTPDCTLSGLRVSTCTSHSCVLQGTPLMCGKQ